MGTLLHRLTCEGIKSNCTVAVEYWLNMLVLVAQANFFSWDESEEKVPARLHLQVWDADAFSADDFIGETSLLCSISLAI